MKLLLVSPEDSSGWSAYHKIRREVLWESRGRTNYRDDHPDECAPDHYPMLFFVNDRPVGVLRVDIDSERKEGIFRRVAITVNEQRQGYGKKMMNAAEDFAVKIGCNRFVSYVARDAAPFYEKLGYRFAPSADDDPINPRMTKEEIRAS